MTNLTVPGFRVAFVLTLLAGCGQSGSNAQFATSSSSASFTTAQLFTKDLEDLTGDSAASVAAVARVKAMSFEQLYTALEGSTDDEAVEIDGITVANVRQQVENGRGAMLELGSSFSNLGEFWTAVGYDPKIAAVADVQKGLDAALASFAGGKVPAASLALADDGSSVTDYVPKLNPYCNPGHDKVQETTDLVSVASAVAQAKAKNQGGPVNSVSVPMSTGKQILQGTIMSPLVLLSAGYSLYADYSTGRLTNQGFSDVFHAGHNGLPAGYFDLCFKPIDGSAY